MKVYQRSPPWEVERKNIAVSSASSSIVCAICLQLVFIVVTVNYSEGLSCQDKAQRNSSRISSINNSTTQIFDMNIAFLTSISNKGRGKFYAGAFFLALQRLNEQAAKENFSVNFNWTFRDTDNKEPQGLKEMADLYCSQNVSVFIGPDTHCRSAVHLATGLNIPYITFNCEDNHNGTDEYLLVNTETSFMYISRFIASVLHHYQWKSFWLITGVRFKWQNVARLLRTSVAAKNISINGETVESANDEYASIYATNNPYRNILEATRRRTRVYVFLGDYESLLAFLRQLVELKMTSTGEYAVVAVDDSGKNQSEAFYLTHLEGSQNVSFTEKQKQEMVSSFQNVLIVKPQNSSTNNKHFEDAVFNVSTQPPVNLKYPPGNFSRPDISHEAYHLYDATMFYGQAVLSLIKSGDDPHNATLIMDYLRCDFHESIQGNKIWIHSNGESEGTYKVEGLVDGSKTRTETRLWEIATFGSEAGNEPVYTVTRSILWVNGQPPISDPVCGFDGSLCPSSQIPEWKIAVISVGVFIFVLFVIIIFILALRHYMYEQKLERLAWKIEREDIQILNAGQLMELTTSSRPKKKDSYSGNQLRSYLMIQDSDTDIISDGSCSSDDIPIGVYKGTNVAVRKLTRKNLELTRALKKQLQLRKELSHENINRFIGACIEVPYVYMVTQYCHRKSLQDIVQNEDSPLDDMFITSLVQDLIRGMSFIHDSEIGYHGNLKSSNCLVDSRWTLKITDFGLSSLGPPDSSMFDDEVASRGLLWTAPELLRTRLRSSNSASHPIPFHHSNQQNNNNNTYYNKTAIRGSQKGDVYSFSIVLYELYGKSGPWGKTKMTSGQIIDSLLSRTTPVLRPDTSTLTCDPNIISIIQDCWDDDPELRLDFKNGIRNRFKPIQQGFLKSNIFDNMLAMMEKYANNLEVVVAERTEQLRLEKKMTENLLLRMLPRSVAEKLKRGQPVEAEQFEQVSIYFSDIVGFTELSAESTPMEVVDLLNDLYTCFDSIIEEFDVYKVETIGDAYMVVSGLPIRNGDRHAGEIASMSLLLLEAIKNKQFRIRGSTNNLLKIRIGIHSGSCCAGVVGLKMPRYCLFGDTVNTASRLESTGEALKIHCSAECKKILDKLGGYTLEERGYTEMKGKGSLLTYFLNKEDQQQRYKRIYSYKRMGSDGRCVSTSNLDYTGKIYSITAKGLAFVTLQNGSRNSPFLKDTCGNNRSSVNYLNTTLDSTCSELPEETAQELHTNQSVSLCHEFISSTLPRASNPKYNNPQMSPIAEDPSGFGDRTLEKTVSFPNSSLHENSASENDALLGGGDTSFHSLQLRNAPYRPAQSNRALLGKSSKTALWRMESFDEDNDGNDIEACEETICDLTRPETVL